MVNIAIVFKFEVDLNRKPVSIEVGASELGWLTRAVSDEIYEFWELVSFLTIKLSLDGSEYVTNYIRINSNLYK